MYPAVKSLSSLTYKHYFVHKVKDQSLGSTSVLLNRAELNKAFKYRYYCGHNLVLQSRSNIMEATTQKSVLLIERSINLRRNISIRLLTAGFCKPVGSIASLFEGLNNIKFSKPDIIIIGTENYSPYDMTFLERTIKDLNGVTVILLADDILKMQVFFKNYKVEYVRRPKNDELGQVSLTVETVMDILKKICTKNQPLKESKPFVSPYQSRDTIDNKSGTSAARNQHKAIDKIIAIGSSTGGTEAIFEIITKLDSDTPPIVIVQHMPPVFTKLYADRLNQSSAIEVREAVDGDVLYHGLALVAPGDMQMRVARKGHLIAVECIKGEKVSGHCPSVDYLFESVAKIMGNKSIGIILTGMGKDGAKGLLLMHDKGAKTIGQDSTSSVVYGMPKVAYEMGAVDVQSSPDKIPSILNNLIKKI